MAGLAIVVAVSNNGVIGKGGTLPWHVPEDLKRFKAITMGHALIMGRKTHESIGRPLPGRRNIVVTRSPTATFAGCEVAADFERAVALAHETDELPMVVGGAELYRHALPLSTRLYLTRIEREVDGDTYFPPLDLTKWREVKREQGPPQVVFLEFHAA